MVTAAICPSISITNTECTDGTFKASSLSTSCSDGAVAVSGSVKATSAFDTGDKIEYVPCVFWGAVCYPEYTQSGGSICDVLVDENGDCTGATGTYYIVDGFSAPIPSEAEEYIGSSRMSFGVTIKVLVGADEECTTSATVDNTSFIGLGMASLFAAAGTTLYFMKRRRRPLLVLEDGDQAFVEMKDQAVAAGVLESNRGGPSSVMV